jgi:hypothetical protein
MIVYFSFLISHNFSFVISGSQLCPRGPDGLDL